MALDIFALFDPPHPFNLGVYGNKPVYGRQKTYNLLRPYRHRHQPWNEVCHVVDVGYGDAVEVGDYPGILVRFHLVLVHYPLERRSAVYNVIKGLPGDVFKGQVPV